MSKWLEIGAFDALEKRYLDELEFAIFEMKNNKKVNNLLSFNVFEIYRFKFEHTNEGISFVATQNDQDLTGKTKVVNTKHVKS
ncbi:HORMA domain containing protein [Reticulomyxa filosa]|uniref:HORMA domain containing protein n=1 Tax=Reticulomyxa filosa TaxID=46433 RepID=X6MI20_RETFI|nr:HORMA domain containing protein [Reticulomyxa filosa]|eukprot:ETO13301.1 HORMA domain containing protein [Reticulomyxa filosa]